MSEPQKIDIPRRAGFGSAAPLAVEQVDHVRWRTTHDLTYRDGTGRTFTVPAGVVTDFATVPRALVGLVPRSGRHNPATILHDHLCCEALDGRFNRRDADRLFRRALGTLGVQPTRRWIMWAAVRFGALVAHPRQWADFARDLPAVTPLTLLALPVVAPAALFTQLALWPVIAAWEAVERALMPDRQTSEQEKHDEMVRSTRRRPRSPSERGRLRRHLARPRAGCARKDQPDAGRPR